MKYRYHIDGTQPAEGEYFVFGSNLAGRHGAGAARAAYEHYGAIYARAYGFMGRSFAIPTKDEHIETMPLDDIKEYVNLFLENAHREYTKKFFMTRIGCGLAGLLDSDIAPMFKNAPHNINFPEDWAPFLENSDGK